MSRTWVRLQLVLLWLPLWALYSSLIYASHPGVSVLMVAIRGLWAIGSAALLGVGVWRLTNRFPWPHHLGWRFPLLHLGLGAVYAALFTVLVYAIEWVHAEAMLHIGVASGTTARHMVMLAFSWIPRFLILGGWFYVMVAGVAYATRGTERAARAEAHATRAQLAALRAQLHPHFLFNALHTVVHLIPRDPVRASEAAEQIAGLLRTTIEEDRDLVPLADEIAFVRRYLDLERLRFAERLVVDVDVEGVPTDTLMPSFALLTLVENAVRHGAAPQVEATTVRITARATADTLVVEVRDTGAGAPPELAHDTSRGSSTGLARLEERLATLYGERARLDLATAPGEGFTATLTIPRDGE